MASGERLRHIRARGLAMAGALAITAIGGGVVTAAEAQSPAPITTDGTRPSQSAFPETRIETQVPLLRIESAQAAALRFGVEGSLSSLPESWEINEWGGAHLLETRRAVKVNTAGAVLEGWVKSKMVGARDALTVVVDPTVPTVEVNGGTFWDFGPENSRAGFTQVFGQVAAKEPGEQPGVTVLPLCAELESIEMAGVPIRPISSAKEAALLFGVEGDRSSDPNAWEINEWGGAHLLDNPTGEASLLNLNGAAFEGWVKANKATGRDAITFVVHPNAEQARAVGGTMWDFENQDQGFQQLLGQVIAAEAVGPRAQADVIVYPVYNCTVTK